MLCLVASDSLRPYVLCSARLLCPRGFSRQEYCSGLPCTPPGDLPDPGIKPRSSALQVDSLPSEPPWKPKDTGVGSLSLLQGTFPTQELNWGLLHCRWILYQLSYLGGPFLCVLSCKSPFSIVKRYRQLLSLSLYSCSLIWLFFSDYIQYGVLMFTSHQFFSITKVWQWCV